MTVPHLEKICTSRVPHSRPFVPHFGPNEMAALISTLYREMDGSHVFSDAGRCTSHLFLSLLNFTR
jgi:hypothetical protein